MNNNNYAIIMAGGIGSRFWPMSRSGHPKQFLDILNTGNTLLQSTFNRFSRFIPTQNILVVTAAEYTALVQQQLPMLPAANIVGEPERKNTAACILLAALKISRLNPDANLVVAPSDHLIKDEAGFEADCLKALAHTASNPHFVTIGIKPSYANTGYGYIRYHACEKNAGIYAVDCFTEKPDKASATAFLKEGNYLWNSGIFVWKSRDIIHAFRNYMPAMLDVFTCGINDLNTSREASAIRHIYNHCENISVDYAILEKADNVYVIPAAFDWSDMGTWNSAWENFEKDEDQNAVAGNTLMVDANGCMVHSSDKKLVLIGGVDDLIVVNTPDALLICRKENEQQIKHYLQKVKTTTGEQYL